MMKTDKNLSYWKNSWYKWIALAIGVLQIYLLWENIHEYQICQLNGIFSQDEWVKYALNKQFSCIINIVVATVFGVSGIIGLCVHNHRTAEILNSFLLVVMMIELSGSLLIFRPPFHGVGIMWLLLWVISVFLTAIQLYRCFHKNKGNQ